MKKYSSNINYICIENNITFLFLYLQAVAKWYFFRRAHTHTYTHPHTPLQNAETQEAIEI